MMTATAALQVNLDAGPAAGWASGSGWSARLVPVLVAAVLDARRGWAATTSAAGTRCASGAWHGIDHGRSDPVAARRPDAGVGDYALDAPVMLVRDGDGARDR